MVFKVEVIKCLDCWGFRWIIVGSLLYLIGKCQIKRKMKPGTKILNVVDDQHIVFLVKHSKPVRSNSVWSAQFNLYELLNMSG